MKTGLWLNLWGNTHKDGTKIVGYYYDGTSAMKWNLKSVSSPSNNANSNTGTGTTQYVNTSSKQLKVRKSPSTSSSVVGKLSKGTQVTAYETSGTWTRISSGSVCGWVASQYLSPSNPVLPNTDTITNRLNAMINGSYGNGAYKAGTKYTGAYSYEQCKGFAKQVHSILFGYLIGSTKSKPTNYSINISSANTKLVGSLTSLSSKSDSTVRNLFSNARPGDFIQLRRSHGGSHSAIFLSSNSSGVTVYECNVDGNNGIRTATYSWSTFKTKNAAVSVYTAKNYYLH